MKHFSDQAWIDLARGVSPRDADPDHSEGSPHSAEAETHLAGGCKECTATFDLWMRVHNLAAQESSYLAPEDRVRLVKLQFAASPLHHAAQTAEGILIFDSWSQPLPMGVRSMAAAARQVVYEAEGLTVDLRFDRQPYSNLVHLIGQVLDARKVLAAAAEFPVTLWTERGLPLTESTTNHLGEFHLEFEAQEALRLSIQVASNQLIRIALADLLPKPEFHRTEDGTGAGNP